MGIATYHHKWRWRFVVDNLVHYLPVKCNLITLMWKESNNDYLMPCAKLMERITYRVNLTTKGTYGKSVSCTQHIWEEYMSSLHLSAQTVNLGSTSDISDSESTCNCWAMEMYTCNCGPDADIFDGDDQYRRRYARCPKRVSPVPHLTYSFCLFQQVELCTGWPKEVVPVVFGMTFGAGWSCMWLLSFDRPGLPW